MFTRFDATKSTKGASKLRRDLINAEIANLRDLLPLPPSTRQRLSQLQLMALVCVYVRKANYFREFFKRHELSMHHMPSAPTPNIGFSKALSGFLMMMTQNGKLLYISDNAAEYLGHSMEDLLIHGDSVYDMIDKQDHQAIQTELVRSAATHGEDKRIFLCRMNVSRNARRQMRFGDQKVVLVQGHYLSFLPLCSRNEPVFLATCTPVAMPETRECVVQGATNVFTSIHAMDMKFVHIDKNGEFHLGFQRSELQGASWYQFLHWDCMREAQSKHRLITQSEQDRSCILLLRIQRRTGDWLWVHCVLQVKDNMENSQQPVIVCTNQVLSEREATVMRANSWLYHYYMVQSKLQYGLAYDTHVATRMSTPYFQQSQYHPQDTPPPPPVAAYHHQVSPSQLPTPTPHHLHPQATLAHTPEPVFRYGRRSEPEPVDYSLHSEPQRHDSPHLKQEPPSDLSPGSSPSSEAVDREVGGTVLVASTTASLGRSRLLVKAATTIVDPHDFMDQWNPSPPWSDTTVQKVPDIVTDMVQDMQYVTTTPPTPVSLQHTPGPHSQHFSFDWAPEQFVPNVHHSHPLPVDDDVSWPSDHRLFPLQPPPGPRPSLLRVDTEPMDTGQHKDGRSGSGMS
ncbi:PAS domain-containing protein cky-1 [Macrosteles quadrilineatus]|uniref:PAS domain-containing protein cky-1 n=1 Tax=Macrosteles quadrilineatus TaxID=74068 RepID=UPI0023E2ACCB|nr:PAS domain-containing protein cky-1 [Macrosteles quadrilineatus]